MQRLVQDATLLFTLRLPVVSHSEKQRFFAQLSGYAELRGKSEKWVLAHFKNRFGTWPRGMAEVVPCDPSPDVLGWIKSRQIAWAKRKREPSQEHAS